MIRESFANSVTGLVTYTVIAAYFHYEKSLYPTENPLAQDAAKVTGLALGCLAGLLAKKTLKAETYPIISGMISGYATLLHPEKKILTAIGTVFGMEFGKYFYECRS